MKWIPLRVATDSSLPMITCVYCFVMILLWVEVQSQTSGNTPPWGSPSNNNGQTNQTNISQTSGNPPWSSSPNNNNDNTTNNGGMPQQPPPLQLSAPCGILAGIPFGIGFQDLPATFLNTTIYTEESLAKHGYGLMAALLMAVDDFNERNDRVVRDLGSNLTRNCTFTFPVEKLQVFASDHSSVSTFRGVEQYPSQDYCLVIGPSESNEAIVLDPLLQARGVIGISYGIRYFQPHLTPLAMKGTVEVPQYAQSLIRYLQRQGKERDYAAIISDSGLIGEPFTNAFEHSGHQMGLDVMSTTIYMADDISLWLQQVITSGYRTIVIGFLSRDLLQKLAIDAETLGMLTNEYVWIILDQTIPSWAVSEMCLPEGSALDRLMRGSAILKLLDGFEWNIQDRFQTAWHSLNSTFVERLANIYPKSSTASKYKFFYGTEEYFWNTTPPTYASFIYDAVISAGLGRCQMARSKDSGGSYGGGPPPGGPTGGGPPGRSLSGGYSTGGGRRTQSAPPSNNGPPMGTKVTTSTLWSANVLNLTFDGASGRVAYNGTADSRNTVGIGFGIFNVRFKSSNGSCVRYTAVLTDIQLNDEWQSTGDEFIYRGLTTRQPTPNIFIANNNYISKGVRATGLFLMAVAQLLSVVCAVFVWYYRKDKMIKASQPEFLFVLCGGSFVLVTGIATYSFDEGAGLDQQQLNGLCMATPWLISLGDSIIYLALFSKLWRIQRVLQFRRGVKINIKHVIGPFLFFEIAVVAVLSTWQAVSPWRWVRKIIPGRPPQTIGGCSSQHDVAFISTLAGLLAATAVLAGGMAWKTRDAPPDISDSARVWYTILTHFQSVVVGVPIIIILNGKSQSALFLGFALLVSTIAITSLSFLIVPKLYYILWERKRENRNSLNARHNLRVSGFGGFHVGGGTTSPQQVVFSNITNSSKQTMSSDSGSMFEASSLDNPEKDDLNNSNISRST